MFNLFSKNTVQKQETKTDQIFLSEFNYLDPKSYYFDSACTTLRPNSVINQEIDYYKNYNSCGHRVKYKWGLLTDEKVLETRNSLLKLAGKNQKDYTVVFCLNTSAGINLVLQQINAKETGINKIVVCDIDHNSVFLPSITFAKRQNIQRLVLDRNPDGSLEYKPDDLQKAIVLTNTQSNIDGRELLNAKQIAKDVHNGGGLLLVDACQTFGHNPDFLKELDFDAAFGSGHKMYGPSIGFIIIKKSLIQKLDCFWIGGSTVADVELQDYSLIQDDQEIYARLEPGLQDYAGIIGLGQAINFITKTKIKTSFLDDINSEDKEFIISKLEFLQNKNPNNLDINIHQYEQILAIYLYKKLQKLQNITILNQSATGTVSIYPDKQKTGVDGHTLAIYLGEAGIMCRSGYHCCHYYLKNKLKYPPLFRISLGVYNTPGQIDFLIENLTKLVS